MSNRETLHSLIGVFSAGSFLRPDGSGYALTTGWEGETLVKVELRAFREHKMEFEERVRLSDDKRTIQYSQKVKGPTGTEYSNEMKFDVVEGG